MRFNNDQNKNKYISMKKLIIFALFFGLAALPATAFASNKFPVDTNGTLITSLVSYWKLEDTRDFFASNHFTNNSSVTFTSGKIGNAATFNGSNYLSLGAPISVSTGTFSVGFWLNIPSSSLLIPIVENGKFNAPNEGGFLAYIGGAGSFSAGNILDVLVWGVGTIQMSDAIGTGFHHIVITHNSSNVWKAYIDGTQTAYTPTQAISTPADHFYVGYTNHTEFAANGSQIDELEWWNKELVAQEVTDLYNGGNGQTPIITNTLGEYLGAGSGTTKLLLHLNGNSNDASGNSNNGTDTAITYSLANGKLGHGAGFNGTTSQIQKTSPTGLPLTSSARTFSIWFNWDGNGGAYPEFIDYGTNTTRQRFGIGIDKGNNYGGGTNQIVLFTYDDDFQTAYLATTGAWTNLIITYDGSVTGKAFINGNQISTKTFGGALNTTLNATGLNIGHDNATGNFWSGALDEIILENRAWTATEIKKYYTYARGRFGI